MLPHKFELFLTNCFLGKDLWKTTIFFLIIQNYLQINKTLPFIWTNFNSLQLVMLCANFGLNRPSDSGKEDKNMKNLQQQGQQQQRQTTDKS